MVKRSGWFVMGLVMIGGILLLSGCKQQETAGEKLTKDAWATIAGEPLAVKETFDELLWGSYSYTGWSTPYGGDCSEFLTDMAFEELEVNGESVQISSVPLNFSYIGPYWASSTNETDSYDGTRAGLAGLHEKFRDGHDDKYWDNYIDYLNMNVISGAYYYNGEQKITFKDSLYKVDGNTLYICHDYDVDEDTYEITEKMPWMEYGFEFTGRNLRITRNNTEVTMAPNSVFWGMIMSGYASTEADMYQEIEGLQHIESGTLDMVYTKGQKYGDRNATIELNDDGKIKISREDDTIEAQYICCDKMGFILVDGGKCYRYQKTWNQYQEDELEDVLDEDIILADISEDAAKELIQTKENILEDLEKAFQSAGIEANIDEVSGKVTMDSNILFAVDASEVSAEGRAYLDSFLKVYSSVITDERYRDAVTSIMIEGHTDTSGSYEYNLELSAARALSVAEYCVESQPSLTGIIKTKGCAYDESVYDEDGNIDMDASRRVVFKFLLKVENPSSEK